MTQIHHSNKRGMFKRLIVLHSVVIQANRSFRADGSGEDSVTGEDTVTKAKQRKYQVHQTSI